MNYQFKYNSGDPPSEPIIDLIISNITNNSAPEKGLIDTGSFITIIPKKLISTLGLKKKGKVEGVYSFNSKEGEDYDAYYIHVTIGSTKFDLMKVIAEDRRDVLIGRDLINLWYFKLDGKNLIGDISPWSTKQSDVQ